MPWIIDYQLVLEQMHAQGMRCLYYNSGAFGFQEGREVGVLGFVGPADETIRPEVREHIREVAPPFEQTLAALARRIWREHIGGRAWVMPKSHWAHELEHGSREWMAEALEQIGLDAGLLAGRNNGAAIEFASEEGERFELFIRKLLQLLVGSDFMIAFPGHPVVCTVHHHKQLWWMSNDPQLMDQIDPD
ncbi:MAG: hypothetical protein IT447_10010 [Phycisphaerales bacterium]|jgi:hypothetical protein|nr:hypothetical protein [Phycisphaerales bacterium]